MTKKKNGPIFSPSTVLIAAAIPLLFQESWGLGLAVIVVGLVVKFCNAANNIDEKDKQRIRFDVVNAEDVYHEMLDWESRYEKDKSLEPQFQMVLVTGLGALAKKYNHQKSSSSILVQISLQAVYMGYRHFKEDSVLGPALSLHALLAKQESCRELHRNQADHFGLDLLMGQIEAALGRAKKASGEEKELAAAELQRKACLLLGALADGEPEMARLVAEEGGISRILQAADWYRMHEEVANWSLWSLFILCFEYGANKRILVELGGVPIVTRSILNNVTSTEVGRHGTALLFDVMRENEETKLDIWRIRDAAINAGLHEAISGVMRQNSDAMDIMMMGGEILAGTNYQGDIPEHKAEDR